MNLTRECSKVQAQITFEQPQEIVNVLRSSKRERKKERIQPFSLITLRHTHTHTRLRAARTHKETARYQISEFFAFLSAM